MAYLTYPFDIDEIDKIRIDITFQEKRDSEPAITLAVKWTKTLLNTFSEIKPIVQVLKRYLKIRKLNCPYKGM